jgi:hypothetical protein
MKKTYIPAEIKVENPVVVTSVICQSKTKYEPNAAWGKDKLDGGLFPNEGYSMRPTAIEDQSGGFDSQTKGRGGDWGSIW